MTEESKMNARMIIDSQRVQAEKELLGNYRIIFPVDDHMNTQKYNRFLECASKKYD